MNFNSSNLSKGYNVNISHPVQPNNQDYYINYKKFVSIHSEDRDIIKYPNASSFEIELPQDMLNVSQVTLSNWAFPANYDVFSNVYGNLSLTFKINKPYNPGEFGVTDKIAEIVYECLFLTQSQVYEIVIEQGFYNQQQIVTELTNKMNTVVNTRIIDYITNSSTRNLLETYIGYERFVVVYNEVGQTIWFGNTADGFMLANSLQFIKSQDTTNVECISKSLPNYSDWGLPSNLGLPRYDVQSESKQGFSPRFFYGDVVYGDNGFWLLPNPLLIGSEVHFYQCNNKINLMGDAYFYMEIHGLNNIDETSPYNKNEFTTTTNKTNGIVNSAFAKLSIPTTPLGQWFDTNSLPYMYFSPPAERIRKLQIRIRYHNGRLVDFNVFPFSFTLEFTLVQSQILRQGNYIASDNSLINKQFSDKKF